jgi:hypothetical protein
MSAPTLLDRVAQELHERAVSGEPAPRSDNWHCGTCGGGYDQGVRSFTREVRIERPRRKPLVDFQAILICPCCSSSGCVHRGAPALMAE